MKFGVLGPTEVLDGDRPVELGPARRRLVLGALLVDVGRVVPVETLLDRVWDGRPPAGALGTLQTYISRLRANLAAGSSPATVATSPRGYALDVADDDVDARRFEALLARAGRRRDDGDPVGARALVTDALELWRGDAFADFDAEFTAREAARLHDLRLSAYELAAGLDLDLGRAADVVRVLSPLVAAEPLREPLRAALMLALYRSGRSSDALRLYAEGREALADQLGADPDVATQALHARILQQHPSLDAPPPPAAAPAGVATDPEPPVAPVGRDRLVGREPELAQLEATLARAATRRTEFVAVVGEAGIGKSRLVEETSARAAAAGHVVAWGRCWRHEGAPVLWPWMQVLRELGTRLAPEVLAANTGGRAGLVTTIVPELVHGASTTSGPVASSVDELEVHVFDAVVAFLAGIARHRPIVVVVDDLQWADPGSRRLTEYVATHLRDAAVTVVVTVRSPGHDEHHPDLEVLAALARLTRVQRIDLPPLDAADVRTLVADRVGDDVDVATAVALHARTGGNPFYVGEIVRLVLTSGTDTALAEGVPDSVRGVIRRRVQRLSGTDQAVLRAAAVVGRTFDIDLLAAVTGVDEDAVDEAVDRATSLGLLRSEPGTADQHRFTHALLQETLLDESGPSRRKRLHRRTAEVLATRRSQPGHGAAPAAWIAHHLAEAGSPEDLERAVDYYLLASDDATERRSYTECIELLRAAAATAEQVPGERGPALRESAAFRLRVFHTVFDGAHSSFGSWTEAGVEIDPDAPARELLTRLHAWWADLHGRNRLDAGDEVSRTMAVLAERRDDDLLRIAAAATHGQSLSQRGSYRAAYDSYTAVAPLLERVTVPELVFLPDPRVGVPLYAGVAAVVLGQAERAEELFARAAGQARQLRDPVALTWIHAQQLLRWVWCGDAAQARAAADAVARGIAEYGLAMMQPYMAMPTAWAVATADLARGLELARGARDVLIEHEDMLFRPHFRGMDAEISRWAGHHDDALTSVATGLAESAASGAHGYDAELHRIRAEVLRDTGADPAAVDAELDRGIAVARAQSAGLFLARLEALQTVST